MPKTPLERRYLRRRRAGKMLAPVRTFPTPAHPLGQAVRVSTRWNVPGNLWAAGHHTGADFACPVGSLAIATTWGRVIWVGEHGGWSGTPKPGKPWAYGIHVIIRTGNGELDYALCHLSETRVQVGDRVRPGMVVGLTGNTGNTTGEHLHLEVRPAGGHYGSDVSPRLVRRAPR